MSQEILDLPLDDGSGLDTNYRIPLQLMAANTRARTIGDILTQLNLDGGPFLPLDGTGTMTGNLDMGDKRIINSFSILFKEDFPLPASTEPYINYDGAQLNFNVPGTQEFEFRRDGVVDFSWDINGYMNGNKDITGVKQLVYDLEPNSITSPTFVIDFAEETYVNVSLSVTEPSLTFSTTNVNFLRRIILKIQASTVMDTNLFFPASWVWVGGTPPTEILMDEHAILTLTAYGTADLNIIASYDLQDTAAGSGTFLPLAGGEMTGAIDMSGQFIKDVRAITDENGNEIVQYSKMPNADRFIDIMQGVSTDAAPGDFPTITSVGGNIYFNSGITFFPTPDLNNAFPYIHFNSGDNEFHLNVAFGNSFVILVDGVKKYDFDEFFFDIKDNYIRMDERAADPTTPLTNIGHLYTKDVSTKTQLFYQNEDGAVQLSGLAAGGDVVGPGSATDEAIARFDLATGKLIQNSSPKIDDLTQIYDVGSIRFTTNTTALLSSQMYISDNNPNMSINVPGTEGIELRMNNVLEYSFNPTRLDLMGNELRGMSRTRFDDFGTIDGGATHPYIIYVDAATDHLDMHIPDGQFFQIVFDDGVPLNEITFDADVVDFMSKDLVGINKTDFLQTVITPAASIEINFDDNQYQTLDLTATQDFTVNAASRTAGKTKIIKLLNTTAGVLTFAAVWPTWTFIGNPKPISIGANNTAILTLVTFGATDALTMAAYSEQA